MENTPDGVPWAPGGGRSHEPAPTSWFTQPPVSFTGSALHPDPKHRAARQSVSGPPANGEDESEKVSEDWEKGQNRGWRWGERKWLSWLKSQGFGGSWKETTPTLNFETNEGDSNLDGQWEKQKMGPQQGITSHGGGGLSGCFIGGG